MEAVSWLLLMLRITLMRGDRRNFLKPSWMLDAGSDKSPTRQKLLSKNVKRFTTTAVGNTESRNQSTFHNRLPPLGSGLSNPEALMAGQLPTVPRQVRVHGRTASAFKVPGGTLTGPKPAPIG